MSKLQKLIQFRTSLPPSHQLWVYLSCGSRGCEFVSFMSRGGGGGVGKGQAWDMSLRFPGSILFFSPSCWLDSLFGDHEMGEKEER